jgi:hypothetical protein
MDIHITNQTTDIEGIKQQLHLCESQLKELNAKKQKLVIELNDKMHVECTSVFAIKAKPSRNDHVEHYACFFSSEEKAIKRLPDLQQSHDYDDNVTWFYSVEKVSADRFNLLNLDVVPRDFPYSGW